MIRIFQQVRLVIPMDLKVIFKKIWYIIRKHFHSGFRFILTEQLIYSDGLASQLVYQALEEENYQKVWKIDRLLTVQNLPRETREGTQRMGERMLSLVQSLYDAPILSIYKKRIEAKQSFGHPAIVFTMVAHSPWCIEIQRLFYFTCIRLFQVLSKMLCVAIPLGQTAGQKIIRDIQAVLAKAVQTIQQMNEEDFGIISPGIELSQMRHERVNIRIFMS